jgi:hypothetical protein
MNLITKILLESKEEENLFKPRKIEDRWNNFTADEKLIFETQQIWDNLQNEFIIDTYTKIYIESIKRYLKGKIVSELYPNSYVYLLASPKKLQIFVFINIELNGETYDRTCYWNKELNCWARKSI